MPSQGRLGDKSYAPADGHGCVACAHPVIGPAIKGSSDVFVNSLPALRVGDNGVHAACCGPNTWTAVKGSSTVFINGRPAHRMGDKDQHCGGIGNLVEGSPNVMVGDSGAGGAASGAGAGDAELIAYDPSAVSGEAISALACTQAQTLREAAKSGVPFCEKCIETEKDNKEEESVPPPKADEDATTVSILIVDEIGIPVKNTDVYLKFANGCNRLETDGEGKIHPKIHETDKFEIEFDNIHEFEPGDSVKTDSGQHFAANQDGPKAE